MRQLGGGELILGNWQGIGAREPMTRHRFEVMAPLLEIQPYITKLSYQDDPPNVTHNTFQFRQTTMPRIGEAHTLVNWHGDHFNIPDVDISPWLTGITPSEESKGKVIFARTLRYTNPQFRWARAGQLYPHAMFVGFEDEWRAMCLASGRPIEWRKTENLLQVAELIAGSDLLISNQNVHFWIACGMGHPVIQETDRNNLNSVIRRDNAQYFLGPYP